LPQQKTSADVSSFWQCQADAFGAAERALHRIGIGDTDSSKATEPLETTAGDVWGVIAAILHLGRVAVGEKDSDSGLIACLHNCEGADEAAVKLSQASLDSAARLLGLRKSDLALLLLEREMDLSSGESFNIALKKREAAHARDALAKCLYGALFHFIVDRVNGALKAEDEPAGDAKTEAFIGVLDIFGFESLDSNGLEQLLINFANEALQESFNDKVGY